MKYGEILDFRTQDKAVVGKKYVLGEHLFQIATSPEDYDVRILAKVGEDKNFPFLSEKGFKYQFAREIIEEEPKYRPYKDTAEMIEDFKGRFNVGVPPYAMPMIWITYKDIKDCRLITGFMGNAVVFTASALGMNDLYVRYTYLDGSPCGIKEET